MALDSAVHSISGFYSSLTVSEASATDAIDVSRVRRVGWSVENLSDDTASQTITMQLKFKGSVATWNYTSSEITGNSTTSGVVGQPNVEINAEEMRFIVRLTDSGAGEAIVRWWGTR